uniref:Macaca fascicularis brain cDNA, clone: QflA-21692 n=1 Tax=Macaca fascicularis TaxID=9541 RepID=I7GMD8_MACFA|nr:unnamed protein product [Macaca fascicularis]
MYHKIEKQTLSLDHVDFTPHYVNGMYLPHSVFRKK